MDYITLKNKYQDIVEIKDFNNYGNLCFYLQKLNLKYIKNKHNEFGKDFEIVLVFHSSVENLKKQMKKQRRNKNK